MQAEVEVEARAIATAFARTSVTVSGSDCSGSSGHATGVAEGWLRAFAKSVAEAIAIANARDTRATSTSDATAIEVDCPFSVAFLSLMPGYSIVHADALIVQHFCGEMHAPNSSECR